MRRHHWWLFFALAMLALAAACLHGLSGGHGPEPGVAGYDGRAVHYVDTGGGGTPLVLVHGWACDASFWTGQVEPMSARCRVIVVDLPGHGRSEAVLPCTQDAMAGAVLAVMDRAGVERAVLVGHSMGGSVILRLARTAPGRAAALVMLDGAVFFPAHEPGGEQAWQERMRAFVGTFEGPDGEVLAAEFIDSLHGPDTPGDLKPWIKEKMLSTPRRVRLSAMAGMTDPAIWRGGPVDVPTLAVYAASPHLAPDMESSLRTLFPELTYEVWNGPGHFYQLEDPARVNAAIFAFLSDHGL